MMDNPGPLLALAVSAAITLAMLLIGGVSWYRASRFVRSSLRTTGTVIELIHRGGEGRGTYVPLVRFTTDTGGVSEFKDVWGSYPPRFKVGDQVPVLYDPRQPGRARVFVKLTDLYYVAMLVGGLGLFFAVMLCLMVVVLRVAISLAGVE